MSQLLKDQECSYDSPESPLNTRRKFPVGAEFIARRGTDFRVWAPRQKRLDLQLHPASGQDPQVLPMAPEAEGYFRLQVGDAQPGMLYGFKTDAGTFADPASRFQPEGPHGLSQIVDPAAFRWSDAEWAGVPESDRVIYEMHIGTFTPEGTWDAAAQHLPHLADLGVSVLEIMPVADFAGRFGWGYDGVNLFAPTRLYGKPEQFRAFVDRAHRHGLAVILDVVYNHFGPSGCFLDHFSGDYFTDRHKNEWGKAINFDGHHNGPVREFFLANAAYWVDEFHLDGLRLDATQQIFDCSADNIQAAIVREVRAAAKNRRTFVVAENEPQEAKLARPAASGGYGIDALWNDDFHHSAMAALTGRTDAYYRDYRGTPQEFVSSIKRGFLFQGQWYAWQKKRRGMRASGLRHDQFVIYLQNHDQIANTLHGQRVQQIASAGEVRALTTLLLLGPSIPLLFQGEEFAASSPFLYFADHDPELAKLVAAGRAEFLEQFTTISQPECRPYLADPHSPETFRRSKLDFSEKEKHGQTWRLYRDLLKLRRQDPVFSQPQAMSVDGAVLGPNAFVLHFAANNDERLMLVNLGVDLPLSPAPEPLLAAPDDCDWKILWSSESPTYGGCGTPPFEEGPGWRLLGRSAVVLAPVAQSGGKPSS